MSCILRMNSSTGVRDRNVNFRTQTALPRSFEDVQTQGSTVRHGLYRVPDKIEEHLSELDWETPDGPFAPILLLQGYFRELYTTRLQLENFVQQRSDRNFDWVF